MSEEWTQNFHRPLSASGVVAAHLERLIRSGTFGPGDRLPAERELSSKLGVSRASVRDGIQELTLKGLTTRKAGLGTIVVGQGDGPQELLGHLSVVERRRSEVVDLRHVCEPAVAMRAALRATRVDIHSLEKILVESHPDLTPEEATALDEKFHSAIANASQNPLLVSLIEVAQDWLHPYRSQTHASYESRLRSIEGHRNILQFIKNRDAAGAEAAMTSHINEMATYMAGEHEAADTIPDQTGHTPSERDNQ